MTDTTTETPAHDYPALAARLRAASTTVVEVADSLDETAEGTRAFEAWGLLDDALDAIDSALRSLEAEEDDATYYPGDPLGTSDLIAAANNAVRTTEVPA